MSSEILRLKKSIADLEERIKTLETSFNTFAENFENTTTRLETKYNAFVESIKSISTVQTHAILEQIRHELRMEFFRIQRDLQRDIRSLRV